MADLGQLQRELSNYNKRLSTAHTNTLRAWEAYKRAKRNEETLSQDRNSIAEELTRAAFEMTL